MRADVGLPDHASMAGDADGDDEEMMELSGNEDDDVLQAPRAVGDGGGGEDGEDEGEEEERERRPDPVDYELLMSVAHGLGKWMQEAGTGRKVYVKDADCLGANTGSECLEWPLPNGMDSGLLWSAKSCAPTWNAAWPGSLV